MTKRQLETSIAIVGILVVIGLFALGNSSTHYFKIPVFQIIYESLKMAASMLYEIAKMIIVGIWHFVTKSWLSAFVFIGLVALAILSYIYRRKF